MGGGGGVRYLPVAILRALGVVLGELGRFAACLDGLGHELKAEIRVDGEGLPELILRRAGSRIDAADDLRELMAGIRHLALHPALLNGVGEFLGDVGRALQRRLHVAVCADAAGRVGKRFLPRHERVKRHVGGVASRNAGTRERGNAGH